METQVMYQSAQVLELPLPPSLHHLLPHLPVATSSPSKLHLCYRRHIIRRGDRRERRAVEGSVKSAVNAPPHHPPTLTVIELRESLLTDNNVINWTPQLMWISSVSYAYKTCIICTPLPTSLYRKMSSLMGAWHLLAIQICSLKNTTYSLVSILTGMTLEAVQLPCTYGHS